MNQAENFNGYSRYYDNFYDDKNYVEEAAAAAKLVHLHCPGARKLLDLGCGTGNHAKFFSQSGFQITGIDKSAEMIEQAKAKAIPDFTPLVADIRNLHLNQQFDAAVALFHVVSYLTTNEDLLSGFCCINTHLIPSGLFLFDAWYSPAIYHQKPEKRVRHYTDRHLRIERLAQPVSHVNQNLVDVQYQIRVSDIQSDTTEVINESHLVRHFSIPEIELLAHITGFRLIDTMDLVSGGRPGEDTWGICFLLKKTHEPYPG